MKIDPLDNPFSAPESDLGSESISEQSNISAHYGGFFSRLSASIFDFIIAYLLAVIPTNALALYVFDGGGQNLKTIEKTLGFAAVLATFGVLFAMPVILLWIYFAALESSPLQGGIGKRLMRLKVVDLSGQRISFQRATRRHFAHYLSAVFLLGFLVQPFHSRKQAWHDALTGTLVLRSDTIPTDNAVPNDREKPST